MNTVAGGGAYYFAKQQIRADRQAKLEAHRQKTAANKALEFEAASVAPSTGANNGGPARTDNAGSPSQEASNDPAATRHAPATESQRLAITKATLSATLFRADPVSLNRAAVDDFFSLLDNAIIQCSRQNVQKCKAWIVDNIVPSTARCTALGKFWAVLSKNLAVENDGKRPSTKRRRLHLLYIANDVLFHEIVRQSNSRLGGALAGVLPTMLGNAAAFDNCPKHKTKLGGLIDLWEEKAYFSPELVTKLRSALAKGSAEIAAQNIEPSESSLKLAKDAPYVLPSFHGDASTPWYDLPAATWLPHITPNSSRPMIPDQVRPIQLAAGPADKRVVDAVKVLLKDADYIYSKDSEPNDDPHVGLSELGERVILDEITGDPVGGESYYGWSRQFCERMRERLNKSAKPSANHSQSASKSRPRSRSRSSIAPPPQPPQLHNNQYGRGNGGYRGRGRGGYGRGGYRGQY
ncbi:hypothetical protein Trco_001456 [Trichoderma cornu-damae]|uniref:CID domain-containing protein n=1 Tax=Trichoderma cornu-damae TaxID=654480 RepID=A0A9P8TXB6_9HYPO|nr:hypothetical protein Trco_001456 [Trichoderma cornu-damae]